MGTELQSSLGTTHHIRELGFPRWKLPGPTLQVKASSSKWARFLLSPGNVDTAPSRPLQGTPQPAAHIRTERSGRKTPEQWAMGTPQAEGSPLAQGEQKDQSLQLQHPYHLFTTGEDFEDDL